MFKYQIITPRIDGKNIYMSFDYDTDSEDIIIDAIEQDLISGSNIEGIDITLVEVPRDAAIFVVNSFFNIDNSNLSSNSELIGYIINNNLFDMVDENTVIVGDDLDSLWADIQKKIIIDVENGDFTAIYELLSSIPVANLKGYLPETE